MISNQSGLVRNGRSSAEDGQLAVQTLYYENYRLLLAADAPRTQTASRPGSRRILRQPNGSEATVRRRNRNVNREACGPTAMPEIRKIATSGIRIRCANSAASVPTARISPHDSSVCWAIRIEADGSMLRSISRRAGCCAFSDAGSPDYGPTQEPPRFVDRTATRIDHGSIVPAKRQPRGNTDSCDNPALTIHQVALKLPVVSIGSTAEVFRGPETSTMMSYLISRGHP